ncbi:hypothetical protein Ancab_000838 [Ancistrocladus abbreviatus]
MAQYGYSNRGYKSYDGGELQNEWSNASYTENGYSDHVCKPVLTDSEGRNHPIIGYNLSSPSPMYVQRTDVLVKEAQPGAAEYICSWGDNGVANGRLGKPQSPVHYRAQKIDESKTKAQTEEIRPTTKVAPVNSNWRQPPASTFQDHGGSKWSTPTFGQEEVRKPTPMPTAYQDSSYTKAETWGDNGVANGRLGKPQSPVHDRGQKIDEFMTKAQTEEVTPTIKMAPANSNWRQPPASTFQDHGDSKWSRPTFGQEEVRKPMTPNTQYKYSSPTKVEPSREDHRMEEPVSKVNNWPQPPNYTCQDGVCTYNSSEPQGSNGHNKLGGALGYNPYNEYVSGALKYQDSTNYGYDQWRDNGSEQFLEKPSGSFGYGEHKGYGGDQLSYPSGNTNTNKYFNKYKGRSDSEILEEVIKTSQPPALSSAVNNVTEALLRLKVAFQSPPDAAAKPSPAATSVAPRPRFVVPTSPMASKRDDMPNIIDHEEAQRKYGNSDSLSSPYTMRAIPRAP